MKNVIKIDRLNIRLKGISSHTAQLAVNGLGSELLHQLARQRALPRQEQAGTAKINTIDAGAFAMPTNGNTNAPVLQRKLAAGIVDAVAAKVTHLQKKGVK
jgi:hypothetical protein